MKNEFEATLTLNHPLTEEDMDIITDVDFDHTDRVWFYTKHGKEVEFVKVTRCKDCKHMKYAIDKGKNGICAALGALIIMNGNDYCSYGERKDESEAEE